MRKLQHVQKIIKTLDLKSFHSDYQVRMGKQNTEGQRSILGKRNNAEYQIQ